jgi:hypothetical protein
MKPEAGGAPKRNTATISDPLPANLVESGSTQNRRVGWLVPGAVRELPLMALFRRDRSAEQCRQSGRNRKPGSADLTAIDDPTRTS